MAQVTFAPLRRATLRDQSSQSPSLRFRPRLRRGSFVLTLIRGSLQMGHPWPSATQSASMPIAPRISARTQPSPTSQSLVCALPCQKAWQRCCLVGEQVDLCITTSAPRRHASRDALRHVRERTRSVVTISSDQLNNCANALSAPSTAGSPANRASRSMPSMIGPSEAFCASGVAPPWASSASEITMA